MFRVLQYNTTNEDDYTERFRIITSYAFKKNHRRKTIWIHQQKSY